MEMRNGLDGLKALLGVTSASEPQPGLVKRGSSPGTASFAGDRATLSSAGAEALQAAGESDARMEKVAAVRAALAAGTYLVPASDVAEKMIDSMLGHLPASE